MNRPAWIMVAVLVSAVALTVGCTTEPRISISDQGTLSERTATAVSGSVGLVITNPSTLEIELLEYHYTVSSGGGTWTGRHAGELVLSPGIDRQAVLPIVVRAPAGGWSDGRPPESVQCRVSGSLVYIGNGVFDETLAELGYRPSADFGGTVVLRPGQVVRAEQAAESN